MSKADSSTSLVVPASGETIAAGRWPVWGEGGSERKIKQSQRTEHIIFKTYIGY